MQEYQKLYDAKHPEHRLSKRSKRKDMEKMYAQMVEYFEATKTELLHYEEDMLFAEIDMEDKLQESLNEMERAKNPYNPQVWDHADVLHLLAHLPKWCLGEESRFVACLAEKYGISSRVST
jgi:hypothetical protein